MSSFSHKIDEWMKEAEARPESAVTIVKLIARRLRELTERNEELLTENIALQNGTRVEEYQKRIAHLEYQLDLLKRRFGADESVLAELPAASLEETTLSLLVYNTYGRIFRIELTSDAPGLGRILDDALPDSEQPRLLECGIVLGDEAVGGVADRGTLREFGAQLVDRRRPDRSKIFSWAARLTSNGLSLIVFPEGTRSADGRVATFKGGSFYLALEAGLSVVPLSIVGSRHVMLKGRLATYPGDVKLVVHEPIDDRPRLLPCRRLAFLHPGDLGGRLAVAQRHHHVAGLRRRRIVPWRTGVRIGVRTGEHGAGGGERRNGEQGENRLTSHRGSFR